jgi:hypothetical protein
MVVSGFADAVVEVEAALGAFVDFAADAVDVMDLVDSVILVVLAELVVVSWVVAGPPAEAAAALARVMRLGGLATSMATGGWMGRGNNQSEGQSEEAPTVLVSVLSCECGRRCKCVVDKDDVCSVEEVEVELVDSCNSRWSQEETRPRVSF